MATNFLIKTLKHGNEFPNKDFKKHGNVKLLSISIDYFYRQFKINKI
jgi:hypothetical protein